MGKKVTIKLTDSFKKFVTLEEAPIVKEMIKQLRADEVEEAIPTYTDIIMGCVQQGGDWQIFGITAEICKNGRIPYNYYTDNSKDFDVWVKLDAFDNYYGFYQIGICLSDIYAVTANNAAEIRERMYIRHFAEVK